MPALCMLRTTFALGLAFFVSVPFSVAQIGDQSGKLSWEKPIVRDFPVAPWLEQGLVSVGNWEGLAFRTRTGGQNQGGLPVDLDAVWANEHSEETVKQLKAAGVTFVMTNFYKTGIRTDSEDMETARKFTGLCHKYGIKVGLYIGGTIFADTLAHDVPASRAWIAYDETGQPIRYSSYRYVPDFDNPGFVAYMKTIVRLAITTAHPDMLHFDNLSMSPPPNTPYSEEVNRRFRIFLHRKYPKTVQFKTRFGFSNIDGVLAPRWKQVTNPLAITPIEDPVMEEWIDFRCAELADYYRQLAQYARSLDHNVVLELNPHGVFGQNGAFLFGIDHSRLVGYGSVYWSEESNEPEVTSGGVLVSKIRSYKQARHLDETVFSYTGTGRANAKLKSERLLMAESMAYNRNSLGDLSEPLDVADWPTDVKQYVQYFHKQNTHYQQTKPVADVAVLRSFPSQAYNSGSPQLQSLLMEQVLIQHKIPFDIISDRDLKDLSRYRAVILADQESLTDQAVKELRGYVNKGGALMATGKTSFYTQWHRRRNDFALADVLGVHTAGIRAAFGSGGGISKGDILADVPTYKEGTFGQGRTVYLRTVISNGHRETDADIAPVNAGYKHTVWGLPENTDQILKALRYAAGGVFSVEFAENTPLTTTMELTDNSSGTERVLHWLNYKLQTPKVAATNVSVAVPTGKHIRSIEVISPDTDTVRTVEFHEDHGRVQFTLPELVVYNVAVINLR